MFERYTEKARRVIFFARYEASTLGSHSIETEHLLLGLLREAKSISAALPVGAVDKIRERMAARTPGKIVHLGNTELPLTAASRRILILAVEEADRLGHRYIGSEHLALGILCEEECFAAELLREFGLELGSFREKTRNTELEADALRHSGFTSQQRSTGPTFVGSNGLTVRIHDFEWSLDYIRKRVAQCCEIAWHWEKKKWQARDMVVDKNNGRISFDLTLADNSNLQLIKGGWARDPCAICHWILCESPEAGRSVGYTNGRDWVCTECYEQFLHGPDYSADAYPDMT